LCKRLVSDSAQASSQPPNPGSWRHWLYRQLFMWNLLFINTCRFAIVLVQCKYV